MPRLFENQSNDNAKQRRVRAAYELVYTLTDFSAAALFIVGSVMFFSEEWQRPGTWCFLFGSILFAAKPTLRLVRDLHLLRLGDTEDLARHAVGK